MQKKTKEISGADERTPSSSEYFSWINSTNEGATEQQTMANLAYFAWMRKKFGMQLDIYAWDAGNLDGAAGTYQTLDSEKIRKQYPNGYRPVVEMAAQSGTRMGIWGGADGFGETDEDAKKRQEQMIGLCRDLNFRLFKFDTVCSELRPEKRHYLVEMIQKCRTHCPDLILLNHRNDLGEAEQIATTFLWEGLETYTDVLTGNVYTGMHNRLGGLMRGNVPDLQRLSEDHGVCLSSSLDYFEDELILQAFGRSLILAPEIYGNPWLLCDWEQAHLARIFTLHRKFASILVDGVVLPEYSGCTAVSRGNGKVRFLTTEQVAWTPRTVQFRLDEEIGLEKTDSVALLQHFPYEKYLGTYSWGEVVDYTVMPFRSALIEAAAPENLSPHLTGCTYEVIPTPPNEPVQVCVIASDGEIGCVGKTDSRFPMKTDVFDHTHQMPKHLGTMRAVSLAGDEEALYERCVFPIDNDALEAQCRKRAGKTAYPAVQDARDAFFSQDTYRYRGCESAFAFDGKPDTFFDGGSNKMYGGARFNGGCLRLDTGAAVTADRVEITYFVIDAPCAEVDPQQAGDRATVSTDLVHWCPAPLIEEKTVQDDAQCPVVVTAVHNIVYRSGKRKTAVYETGGAFRYFRLPFPMDRIYRIALYQGETEVTPPVAQMHLNNLMRPYADFSVAHMDRRQGTVTLTPELLPGSYLAVACEGECGLEGCYAVLECDGTYYGFNRRATAYPVNMWECPVRKCERNLTYFLDLPIALAGETVTVHLLFNEPRPDTHCEMYLCHPNREIPGIRLTL